MRPPKFRDTWLNVIDSKDEFKIIKDCIVDLETGLIIKNDEVLWEYANENLIWHNKWITSEKTWRNRIERQELVLNRMREIDHKVKNKMLKYKDDFLLINKDLTLHLLHPFNRYVYGHLYDTMQKLHLLSNNNLNIDSVLLSRGKEIVDFNVHLNILLDNNIERYLDESMGFVKVKNLLFINPQAHPTTFSVEGYNYLQSKYFGFFNLNNTLPPKNKLFLTRRNGQAKRYLINSEEIELELTKIGVTVLDGSESLDSIVTLFASASHISGVHGALFMNNIFCNVNTIFQEYCPEKRNTRTFNDQFKICKSYKHILVPCDEKFNINLDINDLVNFYSA